MKADLQTQNSSHSIKVKNSSHSIKVKNGLVKIYMAAAIYEKSQCDIKNLSTYVQKDRKIQGFGMTNR